MSCELLLPIKHTNETLLMSDNRITKKLHYVTRVLEKIHVGSETNWKVNPDPDPQKIIPNQQHWKYEEKTWRKNLFLLAPWKPLPKREGFGSVIQCTDPRIRIRVKMSWTRNIAGFWYSVPILSDIPVRNHNTQLGAFHNGPMGMGKLQKLFLTQDSVAAPMSVFHSPCQ